MNLSTVFAKMAMLILIMLLGYLCARIGITGPEFNKRVTPLMVTVLLPATILNSVLGAPAFQAIEIVDYILVLTVMVALQMLPAWLLPRLLRTRGEDAGAMRLATAFGNVGFVGLPVVAAIFGEEMVFFASLCNIPFNLALYSSSASQLSPEGGRVRWQDVLNAPVIATLLSIVLLLTHVPVPGVIAGLRRDDPAVDDRHRHVARRDLRARGADGLARLCRCGGAPARVPAADVGGAAAVCQRRPARHPGAARGVPDGYGHHGAVPAI